MQIMPNKTILEGKVRRIDRSADGWGADVELEVESSRPAAGCTDALQARPGTVMTVFTARPEAVESGKSYAITASVLGGPRGERVVVEDARAKEG